mgnify:FL=1
MIKNLTSPRSGRAVANQFVITTNKGVFFQSYHSIVAKIDKKGQVWLSSYWDYSQTTTKYLYQFLKEYGWYGLNASEVRKHIKDGTFKYKERLEM